MQKKYIIEDVQRIMAEQIRHAGKENGTAMGTVSVINTKGLSAIIQEENDAFCTVYKMECKDGSGLITVHQVYPGIQLIYNDFEMSGCEWDEKIWNDKFDENILEINHCQRGRTGCRLSSGSCLYLGEGDLSIHTMDTCTSKTSFPLKYYCGISVVINLNLVTENPPEILSESGIHLLDFKEKFCTDGNCFIMRAKDEIEHIFAKLYSVPDNLHKPYFKLKVQELLLFLSMIDVSKEKQREQYMSPQVELVKKIHDKLIENLQERPAMEELSKEFFINTVTLKDTFKGIYGKPVGTYGGAFQT